MDRQKNERSQAEHIRTVKEFQLKMQYMDTWNTKKKKEEEIVEWY